MISELSPRLLDLEAELLKALPDEEFAIAGIGQAIRRKTVLQSECQRPLGRFLVVGPSDKVNTLAAELARFYGNRHNTACLQMKNYSEKHKVQKLVGHPGGMAYPCVEEGDLTTPIWRQPETVVVLEEAQLAHLDTWNWLLPIMEEGFAIDGLGRRVSFKSSVFFLSTTVGWVEGSQVFAIGSRIALEQHFIAEVLKMLDDILPLGAKGIEIN